jgi:hypothetical protein
MPRMNGLALITAGDSKSLTISLLGHTVTRRAKVVFEHTPDWPYYDLREQAEFTGWPGSSYHIEVEAVPEEYDEDDKRVEGQSEWVQLEDVTKDGIVPTETWDAVLDDKLAQSLGIPSAIDRRRSASISSAV